jgi:hypothetical protein
MNTKKANGVVVLVSLLASLTCKTTEHVDLILQ